MGTWQKIDTPDGAFTLVIDDDSRVVASGWTDDLDAVLARLAQEHRPVDPSEGETDAADAVRAYYAGDFAAVAEVPVRQFGTDLQRAGWAALRRIEPGAPLTYAEFAAELGNPRAVRAAASVCARNAPALFVPCHRVLRSDGGEGGFAWGPEVKGSLLAREQH
ncbi:methylated-DNA--[protein]-cysteine S-methyltransferase [uncultured Microbacterium sp.]|uniref:methylated-DNA--[protein]-cysteine S-methyltransferase n=1 Tax=uncultured Microbacterium sp. TaxID=191216 RepID=UPI00261DCF94|nr:methylated-DNA--[protein]-cysteine S-methyltransferase [uncultured Microbacterium sp.]